MPHIGNIEYHYIHAGITWSDGGGAFGLVPKVIWEKKLSPDEYNRVPLHLNCLLIKSDGKNILVDTGLGHKLDAKGERNFGYDTSQGTLLSGLADLGLAPEDIDIVVDTHLHADHCGGNTMFHPETGEIVPTFPNAEYWIQRLEWADAMYPNERTRATYLLDNYRPLSKTGKLRLLNGDTPVATGVRTVITRGHTRAHQSVLIESAGEYGFFVADMASLSYHFERTAWVTAYDVEPLENIETKRRWQNWAADTGATVLFQHDPHIRAAKLRRDGRHFKLEPIEG